MTKYLPALDWILNYKSSYLRGDIFAGLTIGVMFIPQGMAYSMLAGLPAIYGLYAATIPLLIYALFGTSRQLSVGPVALVGLLIASGVGKLAAFGSPEFISLAILLALMVGAIKLVLGVFKMGFIVNFLANPVISGFISAAAIIIIVSQLKNILGLQFSRGSFFQTLQNLFINIGNTNFATLALGVSAILFLIFVKKINKWIPGPFMIIILSIVVVYFGGLENHSVKILKEVPAGLPNVQFPSIEFQSIKILLPIALTISFIGFIQSISISKLMLDKHKDYNLVPNQELISLGLANIVGSMFSSFPVTGGFARTAVNDEAGAKTGLASLISATVVILTLLFLTKYFYYLPLAVLSAIIIVAVLKLIDIKGARTLWKTDKQDFLVFAITFLATLILGIQEGIFVGVILSLVMLVYRVSYPHIAELGLVPGTTSYRNVNRFKNLIQEEDKLILRLDSELFFANADYFNNHLKKLASRKKNLKTIILHAGSIQHMDSTAIKALQDLVLHYKKEKVQFVITDLVGPVRDAFVRNNLVEIIGKENFYLNLNNAMQAIKNDKMGSNRNIVLQANK